MTTFEIVEQNTILRATVGSTVHGLHHGARDDRDEMTVFIEPPEYRLGLRLARKRGVRNLSRRAGRGYLGYLRGQKERLLGTHGQKRVNRPELVEPHGFDTKYAMHALRLGHQGFELLRAGRVTLPMPEPERSHVMAVRRGERSFEEVLAEIDEAERRLEAALERTALPDRPDDNAVDAFLVEGYRQAWGW
jgi:uncharacterized protein